MVRLSRSGLCAARTLEAGVVAVVDGVARALGALRVGRAVEAGRPGPPILDHLVAELARPLLRAPVPVPRAAKIDPVRS